MTICFACLGNFLSPFCCFSCSVLLPFCCSPDLATGAKTAEPDIQQAYLTALQGALLSSGDRLAPDTVAVSDGVKAVALAESAPSTPEHATTY